MPSDQATNTGYLPTQDKFEKYLVLAADMSTYDGHRIEGYQRVVTSATSEEEALEFASTALDSRGGCLPLAAHTPAELRELAEDLVTRELGPGRAYNLSTNLTDEEVAAEDAGPVADEDLDGQENPTPRPTNFPHANQPESSSLDPEAF